MADPVLHIKDGYFFEVPKFLWRKSYSSIADVPEFLRHSHPHATLGEFNHDLSGKVLIPQPFGTLKNLYEPASGFCVSRFMVVQVVVAVVVLYLFKRLGDRVHAKGPPSGALDNALEAMLVFVRDEIAKPGIGHGYEKFVPYLWTVFVFILAMNLLGMVPWVGTATGAFGTTLTLGIATFIVGLLAGSRNLGVAGYWLNMWPRINGLNPLVAKPIEAMIFGIEVIGTLVKHCILGVRLLANMVAGHLVLGALLGLIATAATASTLVWGTVTVISVLGATALSVLELGVAFLQAYVFTFLSALFIGSATHDHHAHAHGGEHDHDHGGHDHGHKPAQAVH